MIKLRHLTADISPPREIRADIPESLAERLLSKGANPNACGHGCRTPLHDAAEKGLAGMVKILLGKGAADIAAAAIALRDIEKLLRDAGERVPGKEKLQ